MAVNMVVNVSRPIDIDSKIANYCCGLMPIIQLALLSAITSYLDAVYFLRDIHFISLLLFIEMFTCHSLFTTLIFIARTIESRFFLSGFNQLCLCLDDIYTT